MRALLAAICLAAILLPSCQTLPDPVPGTVLAKGYDAGTITTLRGRLITKVSMRRYMVAVQVETGDSDTGRTYVCACDKATWDGLVEGETYHFRVIEGSIATADLVR